LPASLFIGEILSSGVDDSMLSESAGKTPILRNLRDSNKT
jgi:hypothetical protein